MVVWRCQIFCKQHSYSQIWIWFYDFHKIFTEGSSGMLGVHLWIIHIKANINVFSWLCMLACDSQLVSLMRCMFCNNWVITTSHSSSKWLCLTMSRSFGWFCLGLSFSFHFLLEGVFIKHKLTVVIYLVWGCFLM